MSVSGQTHWNPKVGQMSSWKESVGLLLTNDTKNTLSFKVVMETVCGYIDHTDELFFLSNDERRYGNMLFELCSKALRTGKRGRPPRVLPKGVSVRVKNKGTPKHKKGRKCPQRPSAKTEIF